MTQTAPQRPPFDALEQWGIQFPLLPEDLAKVERPRTASLARAISSWRLSIPKVPLARAVVLDQWGIEFPIPDDQLAAFAQSRRRGHVQARSSIRGGRLQGMSHFAAWAAILAVVVAGSAPAVLVPAFADAAPPDGAQVLIVGADSATIGSLPSITKEPSAVSNPTLGPTPDATLPAEAIGIPPLLNTQAPAVPQARPFAAEVSVLPTIQNARDYLVDRLGAKVDRRWGIAQSECASLIYEYEANWNPHATNKRSGAYGLPQANPASKLANWAEAKAAAAANAGDPDGEWLYRAWRDNPVVQAEWGVDYMTTRYGSPCAALAFRSGYWQHGVFVPGVGWY